jgi:hypothetical protein
LIRYEGSKGEAHVTFTLETGQIVTAVYIAAAQFQHGSAQIKIGLVRRAGTWKVASFQVLGRPHGEAPTVAPPGVKELIAPGLKSFDFRVRAGPERVLVTRQMHCKVINLQ